MVESSVENWVDSKAASMDERQAEQSADTKAAMKADELVLRSALK